MKNVINRALFAALQPQLGRIGKLVGLQGPHIAARETQARTQLLERQDALLRLRSPNEPTQDRQHQSPPPLPATAHGLQPGAREDEGPCTRSS